MLKKNCLLMSQLVTVFVSMNVYAMDQREDRLTSIGNIAQSAHNAQLDDAVQDLVLSVMHLRYGRKGLPGAASRRSERETPKRRPAPYRPVAAFLPINDDAESIDEGQPSEIHMTDVPTPDAPTPVSADGIRHPDMRPVRIIFEDEIDQYTEVACIGSYTASHELPFFKQRENLCKGREEGIVCRLVRIPQGTVEVFSDFITIDPTSTDKHVEFLRQQSNETLYALKRIFKFFSQKTTKYIKWIDTVLAERGLVQE